MTDLGNVYKAGRERLIELVGGLSEEQCQTAVPACPAWSVHDVLAHVSGICDDILTGNTANAASDPWTAAQVAKRRDWPTARVLEEWASLGEQIDAVVEFFPGRVNEQFVFDVHTHEQDIRQALGLPGARDVEGIEVGGAFGLEIGVLTGWAARGLPPVEVVCGDRRWVSASSLPDGSTDGAAYASAVLAGQAAPALGDAEPAGSLKLTPFELMRAASGRRSFRQLGELEWGVDPEPYLPAFEFGPFTAPAADLEE